MRSLKGLRKELWLRDELLQWLREWSAVFLVFRSARSVLEKQLALLVPWSDSKKGDSSLFTVSSSVEEKIGSIFGILFLGALYLNREKDEKIQLEWSDTLVKWTEWLLDLHEYDELLVVQACLHFPLILEGIRTENEVRNERWIRVHSMIIPKRVMFLFMMILTIHLRDTAGILWRMEWIPVESYTDSSPEGLTEILITLLQINLSIHEECVCEEKNGLKVSNEWMMRIHECMNESFEIQFLKILISSVNSCLNRMINTYHSSYLCVIDNMNRMEDANCDLIPEDWFKYYQYSYCYKSHPLSLSFTLSSPLSQQTNIVSVLFLSIPQSFISILFQLLTIHYHSQFIEYNLFASFIHSIILSLRQAMDEESSELHPVSENGLILFIVVLSKLILHYFLLNPTVSSCSESLLDSAEVLASSDSFPSSVLFPFVIPYFLSTSPIPKNVLISALRCYPYLTSLFPWITSHHPELARTRHWIDWYFCYCDAQPCEPIQDPESVMFWLLYWKQEAKSDRFAESRRLKQSANRIAEGEYLSSFVWYLITHLKEFPEDMYRVGLAFLSHLFVSKQLCCMNCLFPSGCDHCCELAEGCVIFLCSVTDTVFSSVLHQQPTYVRRFLVNVMCLMNVCPNPTICHFCPCRECKQGNERDNDMNLIRQGMYQLREKLIQRIRIIMRDKVWRNDPLISEVKVLFPELSFV